MIIYDAFIKKDYTEKSKFVYSDLSKTKIKLKIFSFIITCYKNISRYNKYNISQLCQIWCFYISFIYFKPTIIGILNHISNFVRFVNLYITMYILRKLKSLGLYKLKYLAISATIKKIYQNNSKNSFIFSCSFMWKIYLPVSFYNIITNDKYKYCFFFILYFFQQLIFDKSTYKLLFLILFVHIA